MSIPTAAVSGGGGGGGGGRQQTLVPSTRRLESLYAVNSKIVAARMRVELLERLILDSEDGTDLRAVVDSIRVLVVHTAREHRKFTRNVERLGRERRGALTAMSNFKQTRLSETEERCIVDGFDDALRDNANDDKARIQQLAILFFGLTTNYHVRHNLTAHPQHVDTAVAQSTTQSIRVVSEPPRQSASKARRVAAELAEKAKKRADQIDRSALTLFMRNDAKHLAQHLLDRTISTREYVERCANLYLGYKPAITPDLVRQSKSGAARVASATGVTVAATTTVP
jgi:hypothetical protein